MIDYILSPLCMSAMTARPTTRSYFTTFNNFKSKPLKAYCTQPVDACEANSLNPVLLIIPHESVSLMAQYCGVHGTSRYGSWGNIRGTPSSTTSIIAQDHIAPPFTDQVRRGGHALPTANPCRGSSYHPCTAMMHRMRNDEEAYRSLLPPRMYITMHQQKPVPKGNQSPITTA